MRNRLGAHVEVDPTASLDALLSELAHVDVRSVEQLYVKLEACFTKTCSHFFFLSSYNVRRSPLHSVVRVETGTEHLVPFDARTAPQAPSPPAGYRAVEYDTATILQQLDGWVAAGADADSSRKYFWNAFSSSERAEIAGERMIRRRRGSTYGAPISSSLKNWLAPKVSAGSFESWTSSASALGATPRH